jgi:hypothetical protein
MSTVHCPKCNGEMGMRDVKCAQCGYDFPATRMQTGDNAGLAYSGISYIILALAIIVLMLAIFGTAIAGIYWAIDVRSQRWDDWIKMGGAALFELSMLVVLLRVYDMEPRK